MRVSVYTVCPSVLSLTKPKRATLNVSNKKHFYGSKNLARSTPERALWALAGDIVLYSWARHFTLTVPLSTQVYKWVPANLMLGGNPVMD